MAFDPAVLDNLTPEERNELFDLIAQDVAWRAVPGPQMVAQESEADIIGFGGSAGGGKSELGLGLAFTEHKRVLVLRREKVQTQGLIQRLEEILGSRAGFTTQPTSWLVPIGSKPLIEFGGLDDPGDERKWQGRPHDYIFFDEATEMREAQVRFVMGWLRSPDPKQRKRILMTFNPPTTSEGRWVIDFFAPWLDPKHPNPAQPGELRWFTTIGGKDIEVPDARPFVLTEDNERDYDYDPLDVRPDKVVKPKSRTFIPSRVTDNPYYMASDYPSQLQAMPEPLRSQMLYGDFRASMEDDPWQVIPTEHVERAMDLWERPDRLEPMDSIGMDIAMGGRDETVIARRHGMWFDEPLAYPGVECIDGPTVASFALAAMRQNAVIHLDLFGVGAKPYGHLMQLNVQVVGVNVGDPAPGLDTTGRLRFKNIRSMLWWNMREALDPVNNTGIRLPRSRRLLADLTTVKWKKVGPVIQVESREDIIKDLRRSPDYGSAYVLALLDTPKRADVMEEHRRHVNRIYDPYRDLRRSLKPPGR